MVPALVAVLFAALAAVGSRAVDCNSTQLGDLVLIVDNITTNVDCQQSSATETDSTSVVSYCESSPCIDFLSAIIASVPDCEYEGTNYYEELNETLSLCDVHYCSTDELAQIAATPLDSDTAVTSVDCSVVSLVTGRTTYADLCGESGCLDHLAEVAASLPDCYNADEINYRRSIGYAIDECNTTTSTTTAPETETPDPTTEAPSATTVTSGSDDSTSASAGDTPTPTPTDSDSAPSYSLCFNAGVIFASTIVCARFVMAK